GYYNVESNLSSLCPYTIGGCSNGEKSLLAAKLECNKEKATFSSHHKWCTGWVKYAHILGVKHLTSCYSID
ncbi:MAG: hypothetical protein ACN4GW_07980, partial [Desulforhopalus sp.]